MLISYVWIFLIIFTVLILAAAVFIFWISHAEEMRRKKRAKAEKPWKAE